MSDNVKLCLKKGGCEGVDWIQLVWDSDHRWDLINIVMILWVP